MIKLSQRAQSLKESATLAVSSRAKQMKSDGIDVITFGAGEPDFATPTHIVEAAKQALDNGETKYALPASGKIEFKKAVAAKFKRDNGLDYSTSQICVSYGGKCCLYLAFQTVVDPGDEVIIPTPYWVSYPEQVKQAGGTPVIVETREDNEYKLTAGQLADAITDKTKVLVLNSPSNPGGFTYTMDDLKALADVLVDKDILVFSDEMYDRLLYGGTTFTSFAATRPEMMEKTLTFNAMSKTFAMTGWRLGYLAGPENIIKAIGKLQSQAASAPAGFIQTAATVALNGSQQCVEDMRQEFERRAKYMHKRLNEIKGITCLPPTGAFYCFPNISEWFGKKIAGKEIAGSVDFCKVVLEEAHVAIVPGIAFGCDTNARMAFATSMELIEKGLDRIEQLLNADC